MADLDQPLRDRRAHHAETGDPDLHIHSLSVNPGDDRRSR
jgi:hypothetical protein